MKLTFQPSVILVCVSACAAPSSLGPTPAAAPAPGPTPTTTFVPTQEHLGVHVINVGQGTCILIECPGGGLIVNDCGSKGRADVEAARKKIKAILDANPKGDDDRYPATLYVSHGDGDHYNWLQDWGKDPAPFVARLNRAYYASEAGTRYIGLGMLQKHLDTQWIDLAKSIKGKKAGDLLIQPKCGRAKVVVLTQNTPQDLESEATKTNAESIVLMVQHGKSSFISTGDAPTMSKRKRSPTRTQGAAGRRRRRWK
jgi:beta-lactamase superfamily II metal-dependent hydrolase